MDLGLGGVPAAVAASSRGLGFAIARALAFEGARVAIGARGEERLEEATELLRSETGAEVVGIPGDVGNPDGAQGFVEEAARLLGGLQIVVTNAGGPPPGPPASFDDATWRKALDQNFLSTVRMATTALPHLERHPWGRIVCVASSSARQPEPNLVLSNATRVAVLAFAKTLSSAVAAKGITVNCVLPGPFATDRLKSLTGAPADAGVDHPAFSSMASQVPMRRVGDPDEFGAVVAFLCSPRASFVNGVALPIDGGYLRGTF